MALFGGKAHLLLLLPTKGAEKFVRRDGVIRAT